MKTKQITLCALLFSMVAGAQTFTNIYLPGSWPATTWWTNSPALTNVASSNAWFAVNENFRRASNAVWALNQSIAAAQPALGFAPATNGGPIDGGQLTGGTVTNQVSTPGAVTAGAGAIELDADGTATFAWGAGSVNSAGVFNGQGFTGPGGATFALLSGVLSLPPVTITNAFMTTWGRAGGLLCMDTNYLYISVGSNAWKRASFSAW